MTAATPMKLDFAIFHPNPDETATIQAMLEFWTERAGKPFTLNDLPAGRQWLKDEYSLVALGDAVFIRNDGLWSCEVMIPGTAHYYALRMVQDVQQKFGERELPSSDRPFIEFVYRKREVLLERQPRPATPPGIESFVAERLSRCGFDTFRADVGSIAELWDIFDDYEFQELMGRRP